MIEHLHFIRPYWFFASLPLFVYLIWHVFFQGNNYSLYKFIDKNLAKYILSKPETNKNQSWLNALLILLVGIITITALAGPSFEKLPQPVFKEQNSLVILLDLSISMNSQDISPSRLVRAKQKIGDILNNKKTSEVALITYAADAYLVTPITDDVKTISIHLPSLKTNTIRRQGSRIDRALNRATLLFKQTNVRNGQVLAITDEINLNNKTTEAIKDLRSSGHNLSIIGVATEAGGPIPKNGGGFITNNKGEIVLTKLNKKNLMQASKLGKGHYMTVSVNDNDINEVLKSKLSANNKKETDRISDEWKDLGGYLSLLLIPFILLCFRKGALMVLPLCILLTSQTSEASDWKNLFKNKNQQAHQLYQEKQYEEATEKFNNKEWQASSLYQSENYTESLKNWTGNSSDDYYNRGNAFAKMRKFAKAIEQYEQSLKLDQGNQDAKHNLDIVKQAMQQENQDNNQSPDEDQNQEQNNEQDSEQNQKGDSEQKNSSKNDDETQNKQTESKQNETQDKESQEKQKQAEDDFKNALKENQENNKEAENDRKDDVNAKETQVQEKTLIQKQWLDRIKDDPSNLLKRKFEYQDYINKHEQETKQW